MTNVKNPVRVIQTDFRSGEVSPLLTMRVDSKLYPSGASSLKNCLLRVSGATVRRPGTTRLAKLGGERRFLSFEFDIDEKYVLAFGAGVLDIFDPNGTLLVTFTGCAWSTMQVARELTVSQAGDTMIIAHASWKPQMLVRTSLTTFSLEQVLFQKSAMNDKIYQPYTKHERAEVTLTPSNVANGVNQIITASHPIFTPAWIGDIIRIYGREISLNTYLDPYRMYGVNKAELKKKLDPNPFHIGSGSRITEVTHAYHGLVSGARIVVSGASGEFDTGDSHGVTAGMLNGARTVTVVDEDHYTFPVAQDAKAMTEVGGASTYVSTTSPTRDWDEQTFSVRRGWPSAVCFHEDRLWFGGSASIPDGLWSSKTGIYFNFSVGDGEDDASIQLTVGSPRIARVRHILAGRVLQVFAEGSEFVAKQSDGVALTPATTSIRPQTPYGCSIVRPRPFDGATLFVQANAKTVREFTYDYNSDGFQSTDLTTVSSHLINNVVGFDVLYGSDSLTEQYAFFVNGDGTMAVFHSNRSEGLAGWTPWVTEGKFTSVCTLGSWVYVSVLRASGYWLERVEMDKPQICLDSSVQKTAGVATRNWALGASYAGMTLHVTSSGWYLGTVTADGAGNIVTVAAVTSICAGLNYEWRVVPLPPDMAVGDGPLTGEKRRISSVNFHILDTLSLCVDGHEVVLPKIGFDPSLPPVPLSGKQKKYLRGYSRDPVVVFTQNQPLPVTLLGMTMELSF